MVSPHLQTLLGQNGCVLWFTGLSGSGKSTVACTVEHALHERGHLTILLDGDNVRHGLNSNLGFSASDRSENIRRVGEVSKLFAESGVITLTSFISPYQADRDSVRSRFEEAHDFIEIFMDVPIEVCEARDPKGLYKAARAGKIKNFTGIDDVYEAPVTPEIIIKPYGPNGVLRTPTEMANSVVSYLETHGFLSDSLLNSNAALLARGYRYGQGFDLSAML